MIEGGHVSALIRVLGACLLAAVLSGAAGGLVVGGVIGFFVGVNIGGELGFYLAPLSLLLLRKPPILVLAWLSAAAIPTALFAGAVSNSFTITRNAAVVSYCLAAILIAIFLPNKKRRSAGSCQRCEYDLTGNISGKCPECGTPIPTNQRIPNEVIRSRCVS